VAKFSLLLGLVLLSGASLSACNRSSESDALENDPFAPRQSAKVEDQFGKGFAQAARAKPNSEPRTVDRRELVPVSYTAEPIPIR
jgi:hypothetical protein